MTTLVMVRSHGQGVQGCQSRFLLRQLNGRKPGGDVSNGDDGLHFVTPFEGRHTPLHCDLSFGGLPVGAAVELAAVPALDNVGPAVGMTRYVENQNLPAFLFNIMGTDAQQMPRTPAGIQNINRPTVYHAGIETRSE